MNPPRSESPPDFTFPPKSRYAILRTASPQFPIPTPPLPLHSPNQDPRPSPTPKVLHTSPNFGFKFFPNPTPFPLAAAAEAVKSPPVKPQPDSENKPSLFLAIPLEIRLQIYGYVLQAQKLHHAHLAPLPKDQPTTFSGMTTSEFHTTMLRPAHISHPSVRPLISWSLVTSTPSSSSPNTTITEHALPTIRAPYVLGKMPTSLLISCRQIHTETQRLPFERNTFCFVNWWWSGLFCAARFSRALRPWQVAALREVRLETLARDLGEREALVGKCGGLEAFVDVCESWTGVRSLWIRLKGAVAVEGRKEGASESENNTATDQDQDQQTQHTTTTTTTTTILNPTQPWITHGLLALCSLRTLTLAIDDESVPRAEKIAFCAVLSTLLNDADRDGERREIQVVFEEEVGGVGEKMLDDGFRWFGGEPGDEVVWGGGGVGAGGH